MTEEMKALAAQSREYEELLKHWQEFFDTITPCIIINTKTGECASLADAFVRAGFYASKNHGKIEDIKLFLQELQKILKS